MTVYLSLQIEVTDSEQLRTVAEEEYDLPSAQQLPVGTIVAEIVEAIVGSNADFDNMGFTVVSCRTDENR